jgi:hypothetical protein
VCSLSLVRARSNGGESEKVRRLAEMGFEMGAIRRAMSDSGGDEAAALERLISGLAS